MSWENLFMPYANNKDADQPVYPRSLISVFVVCCLDSMMPILAKSKISSIEIVSVAEQASLSLTRSKTPKTDFRVPGLKYGWTTSLVQVTSICTVAKWFNSIVMDLLISTRTYVNMHWKGHMHTSHQDRVQLYMSLVTRKRVFGDFRPGKIQTSLLSHRS